MHSPQHIVLATRISNPTAHCIGDSAGKSRPPWGAGSDLAAAHCAVSVDNKAGPGISASHVGCGCGNSARARARSWPRHWPLPIGLAPTRPSPTAAGALCQISLLLIVNFARSAGRCSTHLWRYLGAWLGVDICGVWLSAHVGSVVWVAGITGVEDGCGTWWSWLPGGVEDNAIPNDHCNVRKRVRLPNVASAQRSASSPLVPPAPRQTRSRNTVCHTHLALPHKLATTAPLCPTTNDSKPRHNHSLLAHFCPGRACEMSFHVHTSTSRRSLCAEAVVRASACLARSPRAPPLPLVWSLYETAGIRSRSTAARRHSQ